MNKSKLFRNADANENGGTATETVPTAKPAENVDQKQSVKENAPDTTSFIGTVADVSKLIKGREGRKDYYIITLVSEDGKTKVFAISEGFYDNNKTRLAPDVTLNITLDKTIAGVTTYTDRKTGEVIMHTSTRENISNVVLATGQQAKMGVLNQLEQRLKSYAEQPQLLGPMAQLYGSMLR